MEVAAACAALDARRRNRRGEIRDGADADSSHRRRRHHPSESIVFNRALSHYIRALAPPPRHGRIPPAYATTTISVTPSMTFKKMFDGIGFSGNPPSPTLSPSNFFRISGEISPGLRSRGALAGAGGAAAGAASAGSIASSAPIVPVVVAVVVVAPVFFVHASIHRCASSAFDARVVVAPRVRRRRIVVVVARARRRGVAATRARAESVAARSSAAVGIARVDEWRVDARRGVAIAGGTRSVLLYEPRAMIARRDARTRRLTVCAYRRARRGRAVRVSTRARPSHAAATPTTTRRDAATNRA
jgi:hypothetical protein